MIARLLAVTLLAASAVAAAAPALPPARWGDPAAGALIDKGLAAVRAGDERRANALSAQLQAAYPDEPARLAIEFASAVRDREPSAASIFAHMAAEKPARLAAPIPLLDADDVRIAYYMAQGRMQLVMSRAIVASGWSGGTVGREPAKARLVLIKDALDAGQPDEAARWLPGLDDPEILRLTLILDEYRPIQPAVIARWGADLGLLDRERGDRLATATVASGAPLALVARYVDWLAAHDRAREGWAIGGPALLAATQQRDEALRAAVAIAVANAAARAGAVDDAVRTLDAIEPTLAPHQSDRVNLLAGKAMLLGDAGRADQALAVAHQLARQLDGYIFGTVLRASVERILVCAAADAGRRSEADRTLATLLTRGEPLFQAQALLCLGEADRAASLLASAFRQRRGETALPWLQRQPAPAWGRWQQRWDMGFAAMRSRDDLRQALTGYAVIRPFATRQNGF